jgi:hypothetical protein
MGKNGQDLPAKAFFIFHLHVGTRLALRIFIPAVAFFFTLYYVLRPELFLSLMASLLDGGFLLSGIFTTLLCLITASFAARRVCLGLNGWIRHLPAAGSTHRRMAGIATFIAQIPLLIILAGLAIMSSKIFKVPAAPYLTGLTLVGLACGLCVLPIKRKIISRPLAILVGILSASNNWMLLIAGVYLLLAADTLSGPLVQKKRHPKFHKPFKGPLLVAFINWRALRLRFLIPYLFSLPFLGAAQLFIVNNSPPPLLAERVIRFGGAMGLIFFCSVFVNMLAARRPPWPWIRSLPWPAKSRILLDTSFICLHVLPFLIIVGKMDLKSMLPLAVSSPLFLLHSVYSIRHTFVSPMSASGKVLLYGVMGALFLCLIPWSSLLFLALTPWIFKEAVKAEKSQKVSQWLELHHLAAGDPLSWSD